MTPEQKIAKGLTKKELNWLRGGGGEFSMPPMGLRKKGLFNPPFQSNVYFLTPLGLAVRAILEEARND